MYSALWWPVHELLYLVVSKHGKCCESRVMFIMRVTCFAADKKTGNLWWRFVPWIHIRNNDTFARPLTAILHQGAGCHLQMPLHTLVITTLQKGCASMSQICGLDCVVRCRTRASRRSTLTSCTRACPAASSSRSVGTSLQPPQFCALTPSSPRSWSLCPSPSRCAAIPLAVFFCYSTFCVLTEMRSTASRPLLSK